MTLPGGSNRANAVLRYIAWSEILLEIEPGPYGALMIEWATGGVVAELLAHTRPRPCTVLRRL